jgi:plasmid stabilization system protein ParE
VPELRFLDSARDNLVEIASYITSTGSEEAAVRFTAELIGKCEHLASLTGLLGRSRPELRSDIRSTPFKNHLIFFRYLPSEASREVFEVVNVIESHRDLIAFFGEDDS